MKKKIIKLFNSDNEEDHSIARLLLLQHFPEIRQYIKKETWGSSTYLYNHLRIDAIEEVLGCEINRTLPGGNTWIGITYQDEELDRVEDSSI